MSGVEGRCGLCGKPWSQECIELSCEPSAPIEGGGGALQPSASVSTEQADGGVVSFDDLLRRSVEAFKTLPPEERRRMIAAQRESYVRGMTTPCEHGVLDFEQCGDCRSATPPATPIAGGFGSNRQGDLPTEPVADRWADLERLAKAATPGPWFRGHNDNGAAQGEMSVWPDERMNGALIAECGGKMPWEGWFEQPAKDAAFIAAANPAAILELVAAARRDEEAGQ